jgi:hypothetical protein
VHGDDGAPRFRIDVGDEEVAFGAEFFGEEFHGDDQEEADEERLCWLRERGGWLMEVFTKSDVYGRELAAADRLHLGYVTARSTLGVRRRTYVDLGR